MLFLLAYIKFRYTFTLITKDNTNVILSTLHLQSTHTNSAIQMIYLNKVIKKRFFIYTQPIKASVKEVIFFPLILSFLVFASGCNFSPSTTSTDLSSYQNAKAKWASHSGQYYTVNSQRFCECLPEVSAPIKMSVLNNSVLSVININSGEFASKEAQTAIKTVDDMFALIETAIEDDISTEISYNEEYGYPEAVKIDVEQLAVDGGLYITLSNLEFQDTQSALGDITWTLQSLDTIAGPQPVIENSNITLSIDMENMRLNGMGGCNNYNASFVLDNKNNGITVSNVISTKMACRKTKNIMQQEHNYFAILSKTQYFTFNKATLNMIVGGDAGLNFVAVN